MLESLRLLRFNPSLESRNQVDFMIMPYIRKEELEET